MIPQIITLTITIIVIVSTIVNHGKPEEPLKYPIASPIFGASMAFFIILYGGFFSSIFPITAKSWPQIVWFVLFVVSLTLILNGLKSKKVNAYRQIPAAIAMQYIFYAGGFYDCFFQ